MAARLGSVDSVAGHARPARRAGRDRCARAITNCRGGLGNSPAGPSRIGWPLGRRRVRPACVDLHPGHTPAALGSRRGSDERAGTKGHRPGARPLHVGNGVRRLAVLRRRSRALYQRTGTGDRRVFRRGQRSSRQPSASGAVERRRLELRRSTQRAIVVPHDDLCTRRIIGIRDGQGSEARRHRRSRPRTGYLLERHLFRSRTTGQPIARDKKTGKKPAWTELSFPTRWHYDILWGLDYLRRAGVAPDERIGDAIELVRKKRDEHGRWALENPHPGPAHFEMEGGAGEPSRWNTLRALRVLRWAGAS